MTRELPKGWELVRLGDLGVLHCGQSPSSKNVNTEGVGVPYVSGPEQWDGVSVHRTKWTTAPAREVGERTIFITVKGAGVGTTFPGISCAIGRDIYAFEPHGGLDLAFVHAAIDVTIADIVINARGTIPGLSKADITEHVIGVAPLPEQRRIVNRIQALLERTMRAREALEAIPPLLDRTRQSLLAAAFRGDLTAAWRARSVMTPIAKTLKQTPSPEQPRGGREATDSVIPGVAALSVNDPGTPLPEGWAWVPLLRVARQETGHTPSRGKPEYWDGGDIPWIGIKDAGDHHGQVIHDTYQHVTALGLENSSARLLPKGTVCLSRTASVGYVTVMGRDMATSQDFATWTCSSALDPEYLMYALMAEGDEIRRFGKGTTHTTIYFPEVRALHIALAPIEEQREIVKLCRQALAAIETTASIVAEKRETLATLTQAILAKAFRGELVPQDPTDEPASALLARIRAERAAQAAAPKKKPGRAAGRPKTQPKEEKGMPKTRQEVAADHLRAIVASRPGKSVKATELFRLSDMGLDEFYKQLATEMKPGGLRHGADKETLELADAA